MHRVDFVVISVRGGKGDHWHSTCLSGASHSLGLALGSSTDTQKLAISNISGLHLHYFEKASFKSTEVFLKVSFKFLEAEWQDFYLIKWRNSLENTNNHLCGLGK